MAWNVAPEVPRPALGAGASTSGGPGLAPEAAVRLLRDLLAAFFQAYLEDASEVRKPQMSHLLAQAHQHGLVGAGVLPALAAPAQPILAVFGAPLARPPRAANLGCSGDL